MNYPRIALVVFSMVCLDYLALQSAIAITPEETTLINDGYQVAFDSDTDCLLQLQQNTSPLNSTYPNTNDVQAFIPSEYDSLEKLSDDYTLVIRQTACWSVKGVLDKDNQLIIPIIYKDIKLVEPNLFEVLHHREVQYYKNQSVAGQSQINYGLINDKGEIVLPVQYRIIKPINESVYVGVKEEDKMVALANAQRGILRLAPYQDIGRLGTNRIVIKLADKWGIIDNDGNTIVAPNYDGIGRLSNGLMMAKQKDKFGFIDDNGQVVINFIYDDARTFANGEAYVAIGDNAFHIDTQGHKLRQVELYPTERLMKERYEEMLQKQEKQFEETLKRQMPYKRISAHPH